ncbi:MAG: hypothetical protein KDE27_20355 [Planctomycetes bacterium]|nr:hypothetical protein [Planctomycetota bacterium]
MTNRRLSPPVLLRRDGASATRRFASIFESVALAGILAGCSSGGGTADVAGPEGKPSDPGGFTVADTATDTAGGRLDFANSQVVLADVAMDPTGRTTAIWVDGVPSGGALQTSDRDPRGPWSTPAPIVTPLGTVSSGPISLTKDTNGNALAVWGALDAAQSRTIILTARRPAGGAWTTPMELSTGTDNFRPIGGLSDDGYLVVAWLRQPNGSEGSSTVVVRTGHDGVWNPAIELGQGDFAVEGALQVSSNGVGYLVWDSSANGTTVERFVGSARTSTSVHTGVSGVNQLALAVSASGEALVASDTQLGFELHAIHVQRYRNGSGWGASQPLSSGEPRDAAYYIEAELTADGRAAVAWAAVAFAPHQPVQILVDVATDAGSGFGMPSAVTTWLPPALDVPFSRLLLAADEAGRMTIVWGEGAIYAVDLMATRLDWGSGSWTPLETIVTGASIWLPIEDVRMSSGLGTSALIWVERSRPSAPVRTSELFFRMLPHPGP